MSNESSIKRNDRLPNFMSRHASYSCCPALVSIALLLPMLLWPMAKPASGFVVSLARNGYTNSVMPLFTPLASTQQDDETSVEETYYYSPNVPLASSTDMMEEQQSDDEQSSSSSSSSSSSTNEYSFFDEAIIYIRAGSGGQGANSYKRIGAQQGPPDGGNGGNGGNVILIVDPSLNTLAGLTTTGWRPNAYGGSGAAAINHSGGQQQQQKRRKSFRAEHGVDGDRQFRHGRTGKDVFIRVPPGTVVEEQFIHTRDTKKNHEKRNEDSEMNDDEDDMEEDAEMWLPLGSLSDEPDAEELIVARGGEGGEGTGVQKQRSVKRPRLPATGGERKVLKLTLKIVADVALVGVPNAGKSTFLASVTRAKPKIANYPFTTVIPNLGVWIPGSVDTESGVTDSEGDHGGTTSVETTTNNWVKGSGKEGLVLCDVPGLIAGAADGVGLGHAFLRHVERCHVILHLIDATSNDPIADYTMLNREITRYGTGQLAQMPQVVVVNKIDAFEEGRVAEDWERGLQVKCSSREELEAHLRQVMPHTRLMWMSAKERQGVEDLMARLASFVKKVKEAKT